MIHQVQHITQPNIYKKQASGIRDWL